MSEEGNEVPTYSSLIAVSLLAILQPGEAPSSPESALCRPTGIQQLRTYEIFEGNKAAFHARFRDHALPIMKRHGFEIVSIWETRHGERTEFAYLLQWPDEATMKRQWNAFLADEEWSRIKKEWAAVHGRAVGEIQERTLKRTNYSPC